MSYKVINTPNFEREFKWLFKKHRSLKSDILKLISELEIHPDKGTPIGNQCYKIRLAIASKGKGKSGGARVITNVLVAGNIVYLLSIYDKSERDSLSDSEIMEIIKRI